VTSQEGSSVQFSVKSSVAIDGKFDKWEATITFPSTDVTTGVMDVKIQAASVNTGSGMKDAIADRVEVTVHLKGKRVSGPPLSLRNSQPADAMLQGPPTFSWL
jgi:polyisoprenoid-binding protein YceI